MATKVAIKFNQLYSERIRNLINLSRSDNPSDIVAIRSRNAFFLESRPLHHDAAVILRAASFSCYRSAHVRFVIIYNTMRDKSDALANIMFLKQSQE